MTAPRYCDTWDPDPGIGPDHRGRRVCRSCQRVGAAGDAGHTAPPPQTVPAPKPQPAWRIEAAAALDAAVLGEHDREEYR
ncbi:hypothetical protein [Micromonospora sp. WMMD710]|uniref:hypothetical protein n=1 Tax=Micromonospora sp. WMMD710 TaxID=3016085 RepID=UPI0024172B34|nr:hypothetical protein [Micromonospora sp. WMMD710]MDG4756303.1 hypothetical protein [Micromonospora sp. WMMD710]MDG4762400.1 hypothetical protein [Micromonospora sp. WMMD710]MDG4762446.1 hypothetical protein [Micromonospora sp. WMMD710]MDG4762481.1 hypothetical protein [Micromonospora sp. WMMD710]